MSKHPLGAARRLGAALAVVLLVALVTGAVPPASAHPFGDPETATISLSAPDTVRVHWQVGMLDDYTYLAGGLGVLPDARVMLDGAVDVQDGDAQLVAAAPEFRDYLLDHIGVKAGGRACRGVVAPVGDLAEDGVDVDFTCAGDVSVATVSISMLGDLSELYTTLATGPHGERQVYSGQQTSYDWAFDPSLAPAAPARKAALQLGGVAAALLVAGAGIVAVRRSRRRSRGTDDSSNDSSDDPAEDPTAARVGA